MASSELSIERSYDEMNHDNDTIASHETPAATTSFGGDGSRYDRLERLKREKRLAMNRECARIRRKRKKMRMELLESRVRDLSGQNGRLQEENDALLTRVAQLQVQLKQAKASQSVTAASAAAVPDLKADLQRLVGSLGSDSSSRTASTVMESFRAEKLQKLQMMQLFQARSHPRLAQPLERRRTPSSSLLSTAPVPLRTSSTSSASIAATLMARTGSKPLLSMPRANLNASLLYHE